MENKYKDFTEEEFQKYILEITHKEELEEKDKRRMVIGCNKYGVLQYLECLYKKLERTPEEIELLLEDDRKTLKDTIYIIDQNGYREYGF